MNPLLKIVRQRLMVPSGEPHPDANLLCAFAEKSLDQHENEQVIRHLAYCKDCRAVVVLALPEIQPAENIGWFPSTSPTRWAGMRWAVWAACVVVVGVALMIYQREQTIHNQTATTTPPATQTSRPAEAAPVAEMKAAKPSPNKELLSAEKDSAPTMLPGRAAFAGATKPDAIREANAASLSKTIGPRWTLTPDGVLERSLDTGKTWEPVTVAANATFRVITAFGSDIWVGGSAGALYHSTDAGQHWKQVKPSADGGALSADITALEFSDAQHGKLATTTETWTTSDAGQSWQKQ